MPAKQIQQTPGQPQAGDASSVCARVTSGATDMVAPSAPARIVFIIRLGRLLRRPRPHIPPSSLRCRHDPETFLGLTNLCRFPATCRYFKDLLSLDWLGGSKKSVLQYFPKNSELSSPSRLATVPSSRRR